MYRTGDPTYKGLTITEVLHPNADDIKKPHRIWFTDCCGPRTFPFSYYPLCAYADIHDYKHVVILSTIDTLPRKTWDEFDDYADVLLVVDSNSLEVALFKTTDDMTIAYMTYPELFKNSIEISMNIWVAQYDS